MQTIEDRSGELMVIPLSRLVPSKRRNVRRQGGEDVSGLKASIEVQGLLHNLIVCPEVDDKNAATGDYEVVGGRRRLRALRELAAEGGIRREEEIVCRVKATFEAAEASLAENLLRESMHPADEFEAFKRLVDEGKSVEEVAARFGLSPLTVRRRLKLAAVSPRLIAEYRKGRIELDQLMALAVTDDHAAQERAWAEAPSWNRSAHCLRQMLTAEHVNASRSPLARFVTVKAYEKAGGVVVRDLFDDEGAGFLADPALLVRLATAKLETKARPVRAEGWAWVEVRPECGEADLSGFGRARKGLREPTKAEQKALSRIGSELQKAEAALDAEYDKGDDADDVATGKLQKLCAELAREDGELRAALAEWSADVLSVAGAIVTLDHAGHVAVHRGLVRPEDRRKAAPATQSRDAEQGTAEPAEEGGKANAEPAKGLSEALTRKLTAHRTAALQLRVADESHVAVAALVHAMVGWTVLDDYMGADSVLKISASGCAGGLLNVADDLEGSRAWTELRSRRDAWGERIPGDAARRLPWLIGLPMAELLDLLALCVGLTVDTVHGGRDSRVDQRADALADAVSLDMAEWWQASGASYLAQVPKAMAVQAVTEAVSAEAAAPLAKLKKGEVVARAEALLAGTRWLPSVLRRAPAL